MRFLIGLSTYLRKNQQSLFIHVVKSLIRSEVKNPFDFLLCKVETILSEIISIPITLLHFFITIFQPLNQLFHFPVLFFILNQAINTKDSCGIEFISQVSFRQWVIILQPLTFLPFKIYKAYSYSSNRWNQFWQRARSAMEDNGLSFSDQIHL